MNRRAFLQSLLAGSAAAVVGALTEAPKQLPMRWTAVRVDNAYILTLGAP